MKKNKYGRVALGVLGASLLLATGACTDDHFDVLPATESAQNTIWQNVEANPELSKFADLLKRVRVMRTDKDSRATQTFAELLNQPQTLTVFAPQNENFDTAAVRRDIAEMQELYNMANDPANSESLRANYRKEAMEKEYNIGNQFAKNHIARFNYESNRNEQTLRMLNGKLCSYNASAGTFNGRELVKDFANVPSSNGTMHVINGQSTYAYNIFDYFSLDSNNMSSIYEVLNDSTIDTEEFSPELSTPGSMNEDGDMVYVDSIYINSNKILNSSGALIKNEDSLYVAVAPTDAVWTEAYAMMQDLFSYGTAYNTDYSRNNGVAKPFATIGKKVEADSLRDVNASIRLISTMFFSPADFKKEINRNDSAAVISHIENADSLISTNGVIYYNKNKGGKNPMFNGVSPVKVSNGYVYPLVENTIDPYYSYIYEQRKDMVYLYHVGATSAVRDGSGQEVYLQEGVNWNQYSESTLPGDDEVAPPAEGDGEEDDPVEQGNPTGVKGKPSTTSYSYRYFECEGRAKMIVQIPLTGLLKAKYRIRAEMLPNRVNYDNAWTDDDGNEIVDQVCVFDAIVMNDELRKLEENKKITVDPNEIKWYTLIDEVEIDKCYNNLPAGVESFPLLQLEIPISSAYRPNKYRNMKYGLSISRIIVEPVRESEEVTE